MTWDRRMDIFSKEVLEIADIEELYGVGYQEAGELIRTIKNKYLIMGKPLRVNMKGKIHVNDYFEWAGITDMTRYAKNYKGAEI